MRILHICIGNPFTETMYYKENYFIEANLLDGHKPIILADTTKWEQNNIVEVGTCDRILENGARLVRVNLKKIGGRRITMKLRIVEGFVDIVVSLRPDVVLFHNIYQEGIARLGQIKKQLPNCKIYGDSSATFVNSAKTFFSKQILHGIIYRNWVKKGIRYLEKVFFVNDSAREFLIKQYALPINILELNSLPSIIMDKDEKQKKRKEFRLKHGISESAVIVSHSGKMDKKKRTIELLKLMKELVKRHDIYFYIAGSFYDDIKEKAMELIEASGRIKYEGFLQQEELRTLLAASDVYVQPGGASHTTQNAISCGTPVIVAVKKDYGLFVKKNGYIIDDVEQVAGYILELYNNRKKLLNMEEEAGKVAKEFFDYRKLASRLYV